MIPVQKQPTPADFVERVGRPGRTFLAKCSQPRTNDWKHHAYWTKIEGELYRAYSGICAYSCLWIPHVTGARTVEHFKPKSRYPHEAYNWDNYRLVCSRLNGRKRNCEDVLDPFTLQDGWFVIDFPSLMLFPSKHLSQEETLQVKKTIKRLKLNDDECIDGRKVWVRDYVMGEITFTHLEKHAPFIALELTRQGLTDRTHPMWKAYHKLKQEEE